MTSKCLCKGAWFLVRNLPVPVPVPVDIPSRTKKTFMKQFVESTASKSFCRARYFIIVEWWITDLARKREIFFANKRKKWKWNRSHVSNHTTRLSLLSRATAPVLRVQPLLLKPGFHYPSWRPELTARVDGWPVSITRQHRWRARVSTSRVDGPSTRPVNSGSGNRA